MKSNEGILYIEPSAHVSAQPVIDRLTRMMAAALRLSKPGLPYRGFHVCACGAISSNRDYTLPNGEKTHSLCVHYLARHRDEIPPEQLIKVERLGYGEVEPSVSEMH